MALMEYLASRLTRYQRPISIKVVDVLPRTPSLKISRPLARERYFSGVGPHGPDDAPGPRRQSRRRIGIPQRTIPAPITEVNPAQTGEAVTGHLVRRGGRPGG
jgi:hypothetical protein